jgi:hypothetical protein
VNQISIHTSFQFSIIQFSQTHIFHCDAVVVLCSLALSLSRSSSVKPKYPFFNSVFKTIQNGLVVRVSAYHFRNSQTSVTKIIQSRGISLKVVQKKKVKKNSNTFDERRAQKDKIPYRFGKELHN